jgi:prepilin-type N-terminal cleavage/methylation domain-containing protein
MESSRGGFSLMEILVGMVVGGIALGGAATLIIEMTKYNKAAELNQSASTFRQDAKMILKIVKADGKSLCMDLLQPVVPTQTLVEYATNEDPLHQISLGTLNLANKDDPSNTTYGNIIIKETYLDNFKLRNKAKAFSASEPTEIPAGAATSFLYTIEADLNVKFVKQGDASNIEATKLPPLRINFAVQSENGNLNLVDCGARNLSRASAQAEACKALGPDFELVYDNWKGAGAGGAQCYAPIYIIFPRLRDIHLEVVPKFHQQPMLH